jgi:CRP-like cAMP-binding protein
MIMETGALGKVYQDGDVIFRQGEEGNCMYVIQEGQVEIIAEHGDKEVRLAVRGEGEFFGEMAIFEHELRSATVRALGRIRILTVDERNFLRRIHQDPSLAYRVVQTMSRRIRELSAEVARLRNEN